MTRHDRAVRNTGSAWTPIFTWGGFLILLFLIPTVALNIPLDKVDKFGDSYEGQFFILGFCMALILVYGCVWAYNKLRG